MSDPKQPDCPDKRSLLGLIDGTMVDDTVAEHVATCEICQAELDQLTDSAKLSDYRDAATKRTAHRFGPPIREGDLGSLDELAIESPIGQGGMGDVFRAWDTKLGRPVAVKVLSRRPGHDSEQRFLREAKAAAKLRHENVVSIISSGYMSDGTPFLVMPLIEGPTLKERIAESGIDVRQAAEWIRQIATGLDAAHQQGIVHRDVKPGNILLDQSDDRAKLADFGLARSSGDATLTQANVVAGTPHYMSPEQAEGTITPGPSSDIYSLGITLYNVLVGAPPFQGQPLQILEQHRTTTPLRPSSLNHKVPRDLETICLKAIAKSPDQRYPSAKDFSEDLQRFLEGKPILARDTTQLQKLAMWCRRNRGIATLTLVSLSLLLTLLVGSLVAAWQLSVANKEISEEKENATRARASAISDRNAAIESLEKVVTSIYDELSNNAATIQTRQEVVSAAIEALQAITKVDGDAKSDQASIKAFSQIGDLHFLKGSIDEAEFSFGQAEQIARSLLEADPDNSANKLTLTTVLGKLATNYIHAQNPKYVQPLDEANVLVDEVLEVDPTNLDAITQRLDLHRQNLFRIRIESFLQPQKVVAYGESILEDLDWVDSSREASPGVYSSAHSIHFCIGRGYLESFDAKQASEHFLAARRFLDKALDQSPNRTAFRSASAVLDRAHAMALASDGNLNEAIPLFENARSLLKKLSAANPEDISQKGNIANTQVILALAYDRLGRYDASVKVLQDTIRIYDEILVAEPTSEMSRLLKVQAGNRLVSSLASQFKFSECESACLAAIQEIERETFSENFQVHIAPLEKELRASFESLTWLRGDEPADQTDLGTWKTLAALAFIDAESSDANQLSDESIQLIERMKIELAESTFTDLMNHLHSIDTGNSDGQSQLVEALVFGRLAKNAKANASEPIGEDGTDKADVFLKRSINAIKVVVDKTPPGAVRERILTEPKLEWIRSTEAFRQAWKELEPKRETGL